MDTPNYPNNSNKVKIEVVTENGDEATRTPGEPIVKGAYKVRKTPLVKKFKENFLAEDGQTVVSFVMSDVVIPGVKNLLFETVRDGFERMLWGGSAPRTRNRPTGFTSYNSMYRGRPAPQFADPKSTEMTRRGRATHDFGEIVIDNRGDAEEVIERLLGIVDQYGSATVWDLYDLVGITADFTDKKWGWDDLRLASVRNVRGGYVLDLPRPMVID